MCVCGSSRRLECGVDQPIRLEWGAAMRIRFRSIRAKGIAALRSNGIDLEVAVQGTQGGY